MKPASNETAEISQLNMQSVDQVAAQSYGAVPDDWDQHGYEQRQLKTSVYDTYAMCGALLCGFCTCTIAIEHGAMDAMHKDDPIRYWAMFAHQVLVRLCTACALYSTLVFMLSSMYAKTALTQPHFAIDLYDEYCSKTASIRHTGFYVMILSFVLYMVSVALLFFYSLHSKQAILGCICVLTILIVMLLDVSHMLESAGAIFAPIAVLKEKHSGRLKENSAREAAHHHAQHRHSQMSFADLSARETSGVEAINSQSA